MPKVGHSWSVRCGFFVRLFKKKIKRLQSFKLTPCFSSNKVWDKSNEGVRSFLGCGAVWLPQVGTEVLELSLWRPRSPGLEVITEMFLPTCPDLRALRELIVSPYMRSQVQTDTVGVVRAKVSVVTSGFEHYGVQL